MNKKILPILFCAVSSLLNAQNYTLTPLKMNVQGSPNDFMLDSLIVTNTSNKDISIFINRLQKNIPSGWASCFCSPTCIAPFRDTLTWTIPANSFCSISPNFNTDSIPGLGTVIVEVYEIGYASSADTVTFTGSTLGNGITESFIQNIRIYPNPVKDIMTIENINGKFTLDIADESGKLICSGSYSEKQTTIYMDRFPAGYYILNFRFENGTAGSRKILKSK